MFLEPQKPGLRSYLKDAVLVLSILPVLATMGWSLRMARQLYRPPRRSSSRHPSDLGLPCDDVEIPVESERTVLAGWFLRHGDARPTIIVGHELGGQKGSKLPYARFLFEAGYDVLLIDLRNHGSSSDDPGLFDQSRRYTSDVASSVGFVRERAGARGSAIGLLFFSFSTFPALYYLKRGPAEVSAAVLDSGPAVDIGTMYRRFMETAGRFQLPPLYRGPVLFRLVVLSYALLSRAFLSLDAWPPPLATYPTSLLFIGSEDDPIVAPSEAKTLAGLSPRAEYWIAPGSFHLKAFRDHKESYKRTVLDFFARSFANAASVG